MANNAVNYKRVRGDSLLISLRYTAAKIPVDLTGCKVTIVFKWATGHYVMESPGNVTLTALGSITALVPGLITRGWPLGINTAYQVRLTDSLNNEQTLVQGTVEITRSAIEEAEADA